MKGYLFSLTAAALLSALLLALVPIALGLAAASIVELVYQYRAAQMLE